MTSLVTRIHRRRSLAEAEEHVEEARRLLGEARLRLDQAAFALTDIQQSGNRAALRGNIEWQEGPPGARHQAASAELRDAILRLYLFTLPSLDGLA